MDSKSLEGRQLYCIKLCGLVGRERLSWYDDTRITYERVPDCSPITVWRGTIADQAKLRGVLTRMWDMNLTVLSVTRIEADT